MHGTIGDMEKKKPTAKVARDIEALLRWTYIDELPKRKTSSAEGIWDGITEYGQRGGIDVGHGAAQRYPHFGLPHPDSLIIEKAVSALPDTIIDWTEYHDIIAWDLAPLVSISDAKGAVPPSLHFPKAKVAPSPDGRGMTVLADRPRDVILVNTINTEALVFSHAAQGTRPSAWRINEMRAVPTLAERGVHTKIIGVCKGKNSYTSGSYCPLRWEPSPLRIVLARANYFAWHQAMVTLSKTLTLQDHLPLPPAISVAPWIEGEIKHRVLRLGAIRSRPLPLKPTRKLAGPAQRRSISKGRSIVS